MDNKIVTNLDSLLSSLFNFMGEEIDFAINNKIIEYQRDQYEKNFYIKTFLHRAIPQPLTEIYFPLAVRTMGGKSNIFTITHIEKIFEKSNFVTIIGTAGSGKSTLLKFLVYNSLIDDFKIPLKIELRYLKDYNTSLKDYIIEKIFRTAKFSKTERIINRLLSSGKFVFFIDGYDEINSNLKEKTANEIDELTTTFPLNNYIITTRPNSNIELLPRFHNYHIVELNDQDILHFIQLQLSKSEREKEIALKVINSIKNHENKTYLSFLANPLLLSMYILTFQSYAKIPQKKSTFYNQVFETLFSTHDGISKFSYVREKVSGLRKEEFIEVLEVFSFLTFFEDCTSFQIDYLENKFNLIKSKNRRVDFSNEKFIEDLQTAICIFSKDTEFHYSFTHKSFQEYFCALYISKLQPQFKEKVYQKLLEKIILNEEKFIVNIEEFYILLKELDYYYFIRNFAYVILKKIKNSIYNIITETTEHSLKQLEQYCNFLLKLEMLEKPLQLNSYNEFKVLTLIELLKEINNSSIEESIILLNRMNIILNKYLNEVNKQIENRIVEIEIEIDDFNTSSHQIINLLDN